MSEMHFQKGNWMYIWTWKSSSECKMIRVPVADVGLGEDGELKVKNTKNIQSGGSWVGKVPGSVEELISKFFRE